MLLLHVGTCISIKGIHSTLPRGVYEVTYVDSKVVQLKKDGTTYTRELVHILKDMI